MSERYSNVFTLPPNLYAVGSPVVIAAGTLLKDNQNGKIVAQLKFRSISNKIIKAVKVHLDLFDTAGNPIGEPVVYDYLDLSASRDTEFGQKTPVSVAESKARSYAVAVQEVVFADKTTWSAIDTPWESLPRQKTLNAVFGDSELVKQYRIALGSDCAYYPLDEKDIWYCACGALNHADESCNACHRTMFELQSIDLEQLAKDRDTRLAQEAKRAAEEKSVAEIQKQKNRKILRIVIPVLCAVIAIALLVTKVIIPNGKYNDAVALMEAQKYEEAIAAFEAMDGYKDSTVQISNCENAIKAAEQARIEAENAAAYANAEKLAANGEIAKAAMDFDKLGTYRDARERSMNLWNEVAVRLTGGWYHTASLKADGTVVAVGNNDFGQCDMSGWQDIVSISAGGTHTVGLKADGTVVAVGYNVDGRCDVSSWTDIVAISAGGYHTVGLKADRTVVVVGYNDDGQCDVDSWTDIVAIAAGGWHTVGLKADGTVVAVGYNDDGRCDVSGWTDIVAIAAGKWHTVGMKSDGTVVAVGNNDYGQCDMSGWRDIVSISAGGTHTVGLKAEGTVVAVGYNDDGTVAGGRYNVDGRCDVSGWRDIVAISAGDWHTLGLKADGTVVAVGWNEHGQCNISSWTNIKLP